MVCKVGAGRYVELIRNDPSNVPTIDGKKPDDYMTKVASKLKFHKIDPKDVTKSIKNVNSYTASGHDKISNELLKIAGPCIYESYRSLQYLY